MDIAPIKSQRDYRQALKEIEGLMNARRNTSQGDRLDALLWYRRGKDRCLNDILFPNYRRHPEVLALSGEPRRMGYMHQGCRSRRRAQARGSSEPD
ncbi:hypothetical protein [Bradyrhizobium sp.]|jgi:HTH-type transcriptional regulator/antitoxin HigA|uniref:hypothetical protein n=1 Tax=Bradyrhizobium sp. TaxID=376 RepID=UPI002DFC6AB8|nr:hypothetical protein [Bradyrhizobium sp.]